MGFLDSLFGNSEKRQKMLNWQNTLLAKPSSKQILTEQQMRSITLQQAQNDLRIIADSTEIAESTRNPEIFFDRMNLLLEKARHLTLLESFMKVTSTPSGLLLREVHENYQNVVREFLERYFASVFEKAEKLKTEKGKKAQFVKFYESLQPYYQYMDESNINYIERKYKSKIGG